MPATRVSVTGFACPDPADSLCADGATTAPTTRTAAVAWAHRFRMIRCMVSSRSA